MNKQKLECLVEIGKNIPLATLETSIMASIPAGIIAGVLGGATAYLVGYPETSKYLATYGGITALAGFAGLLVLTLGTFHGNIYDSGYDEFALSKIGKEIKIYRDMSKAQSF